ncbi:hypothetical protein K7C98_23705 [Nannocystis pusilla]|uniref:Uncharacterized protein n=2 Tax=Nannocystis pusilla TaxID=889268 RepID=A0ABS7TVF8_9BACT|nr:hypothetical protein [Nannocystis pusilla]
MSPAWNGSARPARIATSRRRFRAFSRWPIGNLARLGTTARLERSSSEPRSIHGAAADPKEENGMRRNWMTPKIVFTAALGWASACDARDHEAREESECATAIDPESREAGGCAASATNPDLELHEAGAPLPALRGGDNIGADGSARCLTPLVIENAHFPAYTAAEAGCSADDGITLTASAQYADPTFTRFHVKKSDGSAFSQQAMLSLYVGDGPDCDGTPANVVKSTAWVITQQKKQEVDLPVAQYVGWAIGERKKFWVGKSESGLPSARASGVITIRRIC